jgi:hydrogenase maturation protein HypF
MELEALAGMTKADGCAPYIMPFRNNRIDWRPMIDMILQDIEAGADRSVIAFRFLKTLAALVIDSARHLQVSRIAISGGVFQNALLNTLIRDRLEPGMTLYTHIHLSPNDECIAFGQVALHHLKMKQRQGYGRTEKPTDHQDTLTT